MWRIEQLEKQLLTQQARISDLEREVARLRTHDEALRKALNKVVKSPIKEEKSLWEQVFGHKATEF